MALDLQRSERILYSQLEGTIATTPNTASDGTVHVHVLVTGKAATANVAITGN